MLPASPLFGLQTQPPPRPTPPPGLVAAFQASLAYRTWAARLQDTEEQSLCQKGRRGTSPAARAAALGLRQRGVHPNRPQTRKNEALASHLQQALQPGFAEQVGWQSLAVTERRAHPWPQRDLNTKPRSWMALPAAAPPNPTPVSNARASKCMEGLEWTHDLTAAGIVKDAQGVSDVLDPSCTTFGPCPTPSRAVGTPRLS